MYQCWLFRFKYTFNDQLWYWDFEENYIYPFFILDRIMQKITKEKEKSCWFIMEWLEVEIIGLYLMENIVVYA